MENEHTGQEKRIYIFLGPPYSGKETQTTPLSHKLEIPVFSMGQLIREGRQNPQIDEAFKKYSLKGLHVPIEIKFSLLKDRMDEPTKGFILDNFPATTEDLDALNAYLGSNELSVNRAFYLRISESEMLRRFEENPARGRADDSKETLLVRSKVQGVDREPVLEYFREQGKLVEINGEQPVELVAEEISRNL